MRPLMISRLFAGLERASAAFRLTTLPILIGIGAVCGHAQLSEPHVVRDSAAPCLRLRAEPAPDATQVDCLEPGTTVTVIDVAPFWRRIRLADGSEGWAAKKFLEPSPEPPVEQPAVPLPADAFLEVHFVDVGQGDAVWVHTHDDGIDGNGIFEGRNLIIDGGPNSADQSNMLLQYLRDRAHHDATIDALILTHPHIDHYRGAETIFRHFEVANYYDPGFPQGGTAYPGYLAQAQQETVNGQPANIMIGRDNFMPLDLGARSHQGVDQGREILELERAII